MQFFNQVHLSTLLGLEVRKAINRQNLSQDKEHEKLEKHLGFRNYMGKDWNLKVTMVLEEITALGQ